MVDPKKIKITLPIPAGSAKTGSASVAWMHLHGLTVEESAARVEKNPKMFSGAEEEPPRDKALKKIQIEIVRNLKGNANYNRHSSPVRRSLKPYDTLLLPRRQDEGQTPLFEFIQALAAETTKRIISLDGDDGKRGTSGRRRSRSRSPLRNKNRSRSPLENKRASNFYSDVGGGGVASGDVRNRLGNKSDRENRDDRDRYQKSSRRGSGSPAGRRGPSSNIHSRLGQRRDGGDVRSRLSNRNDNGNRMTDDEDDGKVLGRDELESQRPAAPPPWEANPEMVPRGGYYFEHDDREGDRGGDRRFGNRFGGGRGGFRGRFQRGGFRGRGMGNRGGFYDRRGRDSSPDWKHDKFDPGADDDQA